MDAGAPEGHSPSPPVEGFRVGGRRPRRHAVCTARALEGGGTTMMKSVASGTMILFLCGMAPVARAGAHGLDANPAGDSEDNHCVTFWGLDVNEALGVSEQLLMTGFAGECTDVNTGEHYLPLLYYT